MSGLPQVDIGSVELDLFATVKKYGRKQVFCILGRRLLNDSFGRMQQAGDNLDSDILDGLLVTVWKGYAHFNVAYHNDIHGFDVA